MLKETPGFPEQNFMSIMEKKLAIGIGTAVVDLIRRPPRLVRSFRFILIKSDPVPMQVAIRKM